MMCNGYFPHTKSCLKTKDEHVNQETIRFIRLPSMVFLCSYPNTNIVIGKNFLGLNTCVHHAPMRKKNKMWMEIVVLLPVKVDRKEVLFAVWVQYLLIISSRCCFLIPKPLNDRVLNL